MLRGTLVLFLIGAVLGTLLDHLHVASGAVSYAAPFAFGQAAWVPALFGGAVVGFADLHRRLRAKLRGGPSASAAGVLRDLCIFAAAYAVSAFAPLRTGTVLALFVGAWLIRALLLREPTHRILHAVACAALGVLSEYVLTGAGAFVHHRADLLRLPLWLPGLYLLAAPLIGQLDDLIERPAPVRL